MQFTIVTGMSGAGKSTVIHILEDIGYYCVDNLPPKLISEFQHLCQNSNIIMEKVAFVVDARSGSQIVTLCDEILKMRQSGKKIDVLFLEASDETIIRRYKETRRKHPNSKDGLIAEGILKERELLCNIKNSADYIIDTTSLLVKELKEQILGIFQSKEKYENLSVNVTSFGFKRGIPLDSDLVFDVRFLPNPFYVPDLKSKTGLDDKVKDFVLKEKESQEFLAHIKGMIEFLLPQYLAEGKNRLVISIGCTGGKHRSVAIAEELGEYIKKLNFFTTITHRDISL